MTINLPEKYYYIDRSGFLSAEVINNTLYIYNHLKFEEIMFDITYELFGTSKCYYCDKPACRERLTVDHVYPRAFGGVSLPCNLLPTCSNCNGKKGDMTLKQYYEWRKKDTVKLRRIFYIKCNMKNKEALKEHGFILDSTWVEYISQEEFFEKDNIRGIILSKNLRDKMGTSIEKNVKFINKYENIGPIIVDQSGDIILKGISKVYAIVDTNFQKDIPIIRLENVKVIIKNT